MRNSRGALWALGLAGAALVWKNRDRWQRATTTGSQPPALLPDLHLRRETEEHIFDQQPAMQPVRGTQNETTGHAER
ncbi:MAG: hypothetical protein NVS4B8_17700 [Herpetosiphon sp.]